MNVILIGMMGSGKTSVGKALARKLKWDFFDVDQLIEKEQKMTVAQIFEVKGEPEFRRLETEMIRRVSDFERCVISTGGGAAAREENWKFFLKDGWVVWLDAKVETLLERLKKARPGSRPLIKDSLSPERIQALLAEREPFYRKAHQTLPTDGASVLQAADLILAKLKSAGKIS